MVNATKLNIIIFTILAIILSGLGYYFFIMKKDEPPSENLKTESTVTREEIAAAEAAVAAQGIKIGALKAAKEAGDPSATDEVIAAQMTIFNDLVIIADQLAVSLIPVDTGDKQRKRGFPERWGPEPKIQTSDMVILPGGYGYGSSTLADWIKENMAKDDPEPTDPGSYLRPPAPKPPNAGGRPFDPCYVPPGTATFPEFRDNCKRRQREERQRRCEELMRTVGRDPSVCKEVIPF
tara:strand:- start:647 stop:1354 length:708 start_codon:yes stop_codon:yes gene_type:complete